MSQIDIKYKPNTTKFDFDADDYQLFLSHTQRWNPGFEFDADWIKHLRYSNGGVPVTDLFKTPNGEVRAIDVFYPMKGSKDPSVGSVGRIHTMACDSEAFHYDCIPFAQLFNGDLLCFDHRTNPAGPAPVVIWLHEESDEDAPVFEYVAPTFKDFVPMLYRDEE